MHSAALAELGLAPEWTYEAIEVSPDDFAALVAALPARGFAGVNVTVPHKLAALRAADRASDSAGAIGAANTLSFAAGEVAAENTDVTGILDALPQPPEGMRALVLGAGGSARAAIWALSQAGADVHVWNRTPERAADLAKAFGVAHASSPELDAHDFDLILNATIVGLAGANSGVPSEGQPLDGSGFSDLKALPIEADALRAGQVVVDLVYGANETQLIAAARSAGADVVDGLDVLVRQGAASLALWTGAEPPLETMRSAARSQV